MAKFIPHDWKGFYQFDGKKIPTNSWGNLIGIRDPENINKLVQEVANKIALL